MQTITPPPRYVNVPSTLLYRDDLDPGLLRTYLRIYGMHWDPKVTPRLKAKDWQQVAGVSKPTLYRHLNKLASSGWLLFSQDGKGVLSFEFSDKVSHGRDPSLTDETVATTFFNIPLSSTLKTDNHSNAAVSPVKRGRKKGRDPNLDHPTVILYREYMHLTANHVQRDLIVRIIKDLDLWEQTLEHWAGHGWRPTNVSGMLDNYKQGGPAACETCEKARQIYAKKRRKSLPEDLNAMIEQARREQGLSEEDIYG